MSLKLKTRLGISPTGRGRIMLYFHKDELAYVESIFIEDILKIKDCAIYYDDETTSDQGTEQPDSIQVMMFLITPSLMELDLKNVSKQLAKARDEKIPVLPVLKESVSFEKYEDVFGKMQYITWYNNSDTELPYKDKMNSLLDRYMIGDDNRERVIQCFRKKIFLSYRKKDRAQAQKLIKCVHDNEENIDIAIWYDEMLYAGDQFDNAIMDELVNCDLFLLAVTPNIIKDTEDGNANYVERIEIPEAKKLEKEIIAVEVGPMEPGWKERLGLKDSQCASMEDVGSICASRIGGRKMDMMTPEEQYLIGLAYLGGILVEKDNSRGMKLVELSAEAGNEYAMKELVARYFYGNGVSRNYEKSFYWLNKSVEQMEPGYAFNHLQYSLQQYLELGNTEMVYQHAEEMKKMIQRMRNANSGNLYSDNTDIYFSYINESILYSLIGDMRIRDKQIEEGVEYVRESCKILEQLIDYINSSDPIMQLQASLHLAWAKTSLSVNYDHLAQYLTMQHKTEEASAVIAKREKLLNNNENGNSDKFFNCVRRAEGAEANLDLTSAEARYKEALSLFDELWTDSNDWKLKVEKAKILYKLAEVYMHDANSGEAELSQVNDYIVEALRICEEALQLDPEYIDALHSQANCYEIVGFYMFRCGKLGTELISYYKCEDIRVKIANMYPSLTAQTELDRIRQTIENKSVILWETTYNYLAEVKQGKSVNETSIHLPYSKKLQKLRVRNNRREDGLYALCSFFLSDERTYDQFNNRWAILNPNESTFALLKENYSELPRRPVAPIKTILRSFRQLIGEEYNVEATNLCAEIVINNDEYAKNHAIYLYEIVDSEYRKHYVLFFSLAAIEVKIAELCAASRWDQSEWVNVNGSCRIGAYELKKLVKILVFDYFHKSLDERDILLCSHILKADSRDLTISSEEMYEVISDQDGNGFFMFSVMAKPDPMPDWRKELMDLIGR